MLSAMFQMKLEIWVSWVSCNFVPCSWCWNIGTLSRMLPGYVDQVQGGDGDGGQEYNRQGYVCQDGFGPAEKSDERPWGRGLRREPWKQVTQG